MSCKKKQATKDAPHDARGNGGGGACQCCCTCDQSNACVRLTASSTRLLMKLRGMPPSTTTAFGNNAFVVLMTPRLFQPHALPLSCPGYVYLHQGSEFDKYRHGGGGEGECGGGSSSRRLRGGRSARRVTNASLRVGEVDDVGGAGLRHVHVHARIFVVPPKQGAG